MSEEIKYEAVFGDQSLFDGTLSACEFASEMYGYMFANGILYYCEKYNEKAEWSLSCKSHLTFKPSAMRRIIRTPTWTVADQKAGKLPEVGCIVVRKKSNDECLVVFKSSNVIVLFSESFSSAVSVSKSDFFNYFRALETPEEKAARLREEWCSKALDSAGILSEMKRYELKRLGEYIGSIHDALQSGELKMPEVQK